MNKKVKTAQDKLEIIANYVGKKFFQVAKELRELQELKPYIFKSVAKMAGMSPRRAYALARISRQFEDLGVPEVRLCQIGWTKLTVIGRYLTEDNA